MYREFIETTSFQKLWKELDLTEEDLRNLQFVLMKYPEKGDVIPGTEGIRKIRIALNHNGKRGGARVIYVDFFTKEVTILLAVYSKNHKSDLSFEEKRILNHLIKEIKKGL